MKYKSLLMFLITFSSVHLIATENIIITSSGTTQGYIKNRVINWDDIPYALPPVDSLRWKAPREIKLSTESIIQPKENNFCVQRPSGLGGSEGNGYFSGSEDCLYLDIKSPKNKSNNPLPVMFWIHGGGNTSGLKDIYDFSKMVNRHDVVVVTINYRLGPFGWFTHPSIQDLQDGLDKTSNFGTLDIIAALEWVQSNISLFGGDKNNVTIFGESAGGHNVFSLLASKKAKGLFHKSIAQSGYTTSISPEKSYRQEIKSSTSNHASWKIVNDILKRESIGVTQDNIKKIDLRKILLDLSAEDFFIHYGDRPSYEEIPLLVADGIVIPSIGLLKALADKNETNIVPTIAGSNRDEVKLWLASAEYFVDLKFSMLGKLFSIPKVGLKDKDAFEIFNSYRSSAWKLRGVDAPLRNLAYSGNENLFAYRYDWDDHRRIFIADFKELIGAAHATEIPLLTGNNKLVGDYGFLIYPRGPSKHFLSKNMMKFWTNFAKNGNPGYSTNGIEWLPYEGSKNSYSSFMVLDNKKNLNMSSDNISFESLAKNLHKETNVTDLEKCVVLLQMFTFVGNDLYDEKVKNYPGNCDRKIAEKFLKDNASFIDY
jgi:para-nitrobenzyl esterase